ncbi:MAG: tol-pal system-associated acyl-CoA thioesterase [Gammaproteobacteria bacterium]|nr:tol-pal system-associated acyl-CoA thioesterase [Gammaproteobacteria bacterium]
MNTFQWPVRVYYEDTDSGGVVYYANYLKFMERARTEWLRSFGLEQDELIEKNAVIFAVRSVQVDYLAPARFNEQLLVTSSIIEAGRASLVFEQTITKENNKRILCKGRVKIASLNTQTFKPCPMPKQILEDLKTGDK